MAPYCRACRFVRQLKLAGNLARCPVAVGGRGGGGGRRGGGGSGGGGSGGGARGSGPDAASAGPGDDHAADPPGAQIIEWEEADRYSFEDSDRFEEDSLCSWSSVSESFCNNWRGWRRPSPGFTTTKKTAEGECAQMLLLFPRPCAFGPARGGRLRPLNWLVFSNRNAPCTVHLNSR